MFKLGLSQEKISVKFVFLFHEMSKSEATSFHTDKPK